MLHIQEEMLAHYGVLQLCGRIDFYGVETFKAALKKMEQAPITHLIVNLSEVPFLDSTSLGVLVAAQKRFSRTKKTIYLVIDPENATGQVMSLSSVQTIMSTFHNFKEAISSITASVNQL